VVGKNLEEGLRVGDSREVSNDDERAAACLR
jgi:hypothetical protein